MKVRALGDAAVCQLNTVHVGGKSKVIEAVQVLWKELTAGGMGTGASSIHGALHFKWVVNDSPYSLGKQP